MDCDQGRDYNQHYHQAMPSRRNIETIHSRVPNSTHNHSVHYYPPQQRVHSQHHQPYSSTAISQHQQGNRNQSSTRTISSQNSLKATSESSHTIESNSTLDQHRLHESRLSSSSVSKREVYPVSSNASYEQAKYQRFYKEQHHGNKAEASSVSSVQHHYHQYRSHYVDHNGPSHYNHHPSHYPHHHEQRSYMGHNMHHRSGTDNHAYYPYPGHPSRAVPTRHHDLNTSVPSNYNYGQFPQESNHRPSHAPPHTYVPGSEISSSHDERRSQFHPPPPPPIHSSAYQAGQHYPRRWAPRESLTKVRESDSLTEEHQQSSIAGKETALSPKDSGQSTGSLEDITSKENMGSGSNNFGGCTCKKSKCLKLYCQCFASSRLCSTDQLSACRCINCHNTPDHEADRQHARRVILERNPSAFQTKFRECPTTTEIKILHPSNKDNNMLHSDHQDCTAAMEIKPTSVKYVHVVSETNHPVNNSKIAKSSRFYYNDDQNQSRHVALPPIASNFEPQSSHGTIQRHVSSSETLTNEDSNGINSELLSYNKSDGYWSASAPSHVQSNGESSNSSPVKVVTAATPMHTSVLAHKLGCKCRKSFCLKKYCECFHGGVKCGDSCRCINCKNRPNIPSQVQCPVQQSPLVEIAPAMETAASNCSKDATNYHRNENEGSDENKATLMAALAMTSLFSAKVTSSPESAISTCNVYDKNCNTTSHSSEEPSPIQERKTSPSQSPVPTVARQVSSSPESKRYETHSMTLKRKSSSSNTATNLVSATSSDDDHQSVASIHTMQCNEHLIEVKNSANSQAKRPRLCTTGSDDSSYYRSNLNCNSIPMLCSSGSVSPTMVPSQYKYSQSVNSSLTRVSTSCFVCGCLSEKLYNVARPNMNSVPQSLPNSHEEKQGVRNSSIQCCFSCKEHLDYVSRNGDKKCDGINLLPKSLSYRKICSKCGKTRGEHGELGFGNKCVFQDCGKCGAGVQMHVKANVPMGFLCTLTVKEGATPGAAEQYLSKINDLAVAAALKKKLKTETVSV